MRDVVRNLGLVNNLALSKLQIPLVVFRQSWHVWVKVSQIPPGVRTATSTMESGTFCVEFGT